jgi:hypothetical protein
LDRQVDLVLMIGDLHDIDEAPRARRPDLSECHTRQQDTE